MTPRQSVPLGRSLGTAELGGLEAKALERKSGYECLFETTMVYISVVKGTDVIFAFSAERGELLESLHLGEPGLPVFQASQVVRTALW